MLQTLSSKIHESSYLFEGVNYPCLFEMPNVKWITILTDLISLNTLLFLKVQVLPFLLSLCVHSAFAGRWVWCLVTWCWWEAEAGGLKPSCTHCWHSSKPKPRVNAPSEFKTCNPHLSWAPQLTQSTWVWHVKPATVW